MRVGIFINKSVGALALSLVAVLTYAAPAIVAPVAVGPAAVGPVAVGPAAVDPAAVAPVAVAWQSHQPVGTPVPTFFSKEITEAPVPALPTAEIAEAPSSPTLSAACLAEASTPTSPQVTSPKRFSVKTKAQRYIETAARGEALKSSVFGVLAVTEGGDTLACWNSDQRMVPASTMKLITTGMAIHLLGPDFKYITRIGYSGVIKDGTLDGDLYIVGGGDPTIASKDSISISRTDLFRQWKSFLDKAGIKRVSGNVIGDGRYFDGPMEHDTWSYQDIGTAYGAGLNGLSFYENAQDFRVSAGPSVGSPVNVSVIFPATPWMKYEYSCKTAPAGTGDQLYLFNSDFAPRAEVRGSFAIDRKPKVEEFSNRFGSYTCAYYFCDYLRSNGIAVSRTPADIIRGRIRTDLSSSEYSRYASKVDDLNMLGQTYSPSLARIARETNLKSDNFYAETLFRTLGRRLHHSASYDSSYVAMNEVMKSLGICADDVRIVDGSGLARHNYISPSFFVRFLSAMMDSPSFADYIQTIAQPGSRHYESRLRVSPASVKSRVHLKSGSMNGVRCFSGYIEPSAGSKSDTIVFSIMTNNSLAPASRLDPIIDRIITLLATDN